MKKKVLIVCNQNPYPVINGGIERLIKDYESYVLSDFDVYLFFYNEGSPLQLLHYGSPVPIEGTIEKALEQNFEFILFINYETNFQDDELIRPLLNRIPSFLFAQSHPIEQLSDKFYRGIFTHQSSNPHPDVLVLGGSYNPDIFYKDRRGEELILTVGRIHVEKNQLELVQNYKEKIYERYNLPLYLIGGGRGGARGLVYFSEVYEYVDNVSVWGTADPHDPRADSNWRTPSEIADLCNRARLFVMASPEESFCIALIEAMACGTTCVVNGNYAGFKRDDLAPHVYGNVAEKHGTTLDLIEEALRRDIRIDGSEWVKKFSLTETKSALLDFIGRRL
jgi:glycosyltransferase involved in cell wall biosynthesis